jgi:hypothetical protein
MAEISGLTNGHVNYCRKGVRKIALIIKLVKAVQVIKIFKMIIGKNTSDKNY